MNKINKSISNISPLEADSLRINTLKYRGRAYFWDWSYRYYLRDASYKKRRHIHKEMLLADLNPDGVSQAHFTLICKILYRKD